MAPSEKTKRTIQVILAILGFSSAILGVLGEFYKKRDVRAVDIRAAVPNSVECKYSRTQASFFLDFTAASLLMVAQFTMTGVGISICCRSGPLVPPNPSARTNKIVAIVSFLASWIIFLNAIALLSVGSTIYTANNSSSWTEVCPEVRPILFVGVALLDSATIILGLIFLRAAWAAKDGKTVPPPSSEITLGQIYHSRIPPPSGNTQSQPYPYAPFPLPAQDSTSYPYGSAKFAPPNPYLVDGYPKHPALGQGV